MTNVLDGIEYRTLNPNLPSWNKDVYTDWLPAGNLTSFPSGTQFRVPPKFTYEVASRDNENVQSVVELRTPSKDNAMKKVAQLVEEGKAVRLEKHEVPTLTASGHMAENHVQFKLAGQDKWTHAQYLTQGSMGVTSKIQFRARPDNYFQVDVKNGIALSTLDFDDVEELARYIDRQIRTSENNITITRRSYGARILSI